MLNNSALDAVHICTPHYLHAPMIVEALGRGINVLCEKPLCINEEQLTDIENAVKGSKAQLAVCLQSRFNESAVFAKDYFKDKQIIAATANLTWRRDGEYYAADAWRGTLDKEGGGVMINQAIHTLDLLSWICGMPKSVIAYVSNNSLRGKIEVEDTAHGLFFLENGGTFVMNATNASAKNLPNYMSFTDGEDILEISSNNLILNGKQVMTDGGAPIFGKVEWGTGHAKLIREYYGCIARNEKFPIDFDEAKKSVKMIFKMYQSFGERLDI